MKHISNEQKAREIANDNCTHICLADCSAESYFSSENDCYKAAMQAMAWKDKERKELWRITRNHYQEWAEEQIAQEKQKLIKRTVDWVQKEATKHIGFNAISEECSLSWDFTDLLVKAMKGE